MIKHTIYFAVVALFTLNGYGNVIPNEESSTEPFSTSPTEGTFTNANPDNPFAVADELLNKLSDTIEDAIVDARGQLDEMVDELLEIGKSVSDSAPNTLNATLNVLLSKLDEVRQFAEDNNVNGDNCVEPADVQINSYARQGLTSTNSCIEIRVQQYDAVIEQSVNQTYKVRNVVTIFQTLVDSCRSSEIPDICINGAIVEINEEIKHVGDIVQREVDTTSEIFKKAEPALNECLSLNVNNLNALGQLQIDVAKECVNDKIGKQ